MLTAELVAFGVVHDVFVVATAALGAVGFESARGGAVGEAVGRHVVAVVNPAGDGGPIEVTFQEVDDDFLANAGNVSGTPAFAGPGVGYAHPAEAGFVGFAVAVPVGLSLDPAVLIGPDLLASIADDDGGLGTLDPGLGGILGGRGWHPGW